MLLKDKVALVTGAATGIGEATARLFAAEGANVYLLDRDRSLNESTAQSIRTTGAAFAEAIPADVTDSAAIQSATNAALNRFGRIDILINNAGIYPRSKFIDLTEADWDHMHNVNLKGVFRCIKAVAPSMLEQKSGKIVNISSVTFHLGTPLLSHYVATKGGVIGLTRSLAREFGENNIHVNCITPGGIQTESEKDFVTPEQAQVFIANQSLKRRLRPIDIARAALFLSSELSDGITGQTLNVDGGWAMY